MAKQVKIQPGMKVRVARFTSDVGSLFRTDYGDNGWPHGIKFGAVCRVISVNERDNEAEVIGPLIDSSWNDTQFVSLSPIKPAKQANKKA